MLLYNCNRVLQSRSKNMLPSRRDPNGQERAKSTKQARTEPILPICGNPRVLLHSSLKSALNDTIFRKRKAWDDFVRRKLQCFSHERTTYHQNSSKSHYDNHSPSPCPSKHTTTYPTHDYIEWSHWQSKTNVRWLRNDKLKSVKNDQTLTMAPYNHCHPTPI